MKPRDTWLAWPIALLCVQTNLLAYSGQGDGTAGKPYEIADIADFQQLSSTPTDWSMSFILTAGIDLAGQSFGRSPISPDTSSAYGFQGSVFTGVFDGKGHVISNLTIHAPAEQYIGLFGNIGTGATIRNLGVTDVELSGYSQVGGLVGRAEHCTLTDCHVTGSVSGEVQASVPWLAVSDVGGLVGVISYSTLTKCSAEVSVSGYAQVGGLAGANQYGKLISCQATGPVSGTGYVGGLVGGNIGGWGPVGTLTACFATGAVTGAGARIGGLVGSNHSGQVANCYASGAVRGNYRVGGLAGETNMGTVRFAYSTGSVAGTGYYREVGGLVGKSVLEGQSCNWDDGCQCYNCQNYSDDAPWLVGESFWDIQTSGQSVSAGGIGKVTAEMMNPATFTNAGWDLVNVWRMPPSDYPRLGAGDLGTVVPDSPCNTADNSRTLVNGTCWRFHLVPNSPLTAGTGVVRWTATEEGEFFDSLYSSSYGPTVTTVVPSVWFKAGTVSTKICAEFFDNNGVSQGRFKPATVIVKTIRTMEQADYPADYLGFWTKESLGADLRFFPYTIASKGCLLTCFAMLSDYYGLGLLPPDLNSLFKSQRFTNGTLAYYHGSYSLTSVSPNGSPPSTTWTQNSMKPVALDIVNAIGVAGPVTEEDAWANPVFNGVDIDDWGLPMWIASKHKLSFSSQPAITSITDQCILDRLTQNEPVPVIIRVTHKGTTKMHFVLAVGLSESGDVMVQDPATDKVTEPCPYSDLITKVKKDYVLHSAVLPGGPGVSKNSLKVKAACAAHLLLTNSLGQRTGVLPGGEYVNEIADSYYLTGNSEGEATLYDPALFRVPGHKTLNVPVEGAQGYVLSVVGTAPSPCFLAAALTNDSAETGLSVLETVFVDDGVKWDFSLATDSVGSNVAAALIVPTSGTVTEDIGVYVLNGGIANEGVATSLKKKLEVVAESLAGSDTKAATRVLGAFINEVEAQRGKQISNTAANDLVFHARYMIQHM